MKLRIDDDGDIWDDDTNTIYGPEVILGRIAHVQDVCRTSIDHDRPIETGPNHWTDRHWLAQSVLNILGGNIDDQIIRELPDRPDSDLTTSARDDAITKVGALLQLAVGYAIQGGYLTDDFAKTHAEPVVDALLAAMREQAESLTR